MTEQEPDEEAAFQALESKLADRRRALGTSAEPPPKPPPPPMPPPVAGFKRNKCAEVFC